MKRQISVFLTGLALTIVVSVTPQKANAWAGYAAAYAAGYGTACVICDSAIVGAFSSVQAAIAASEQVLLESMGMGASRTSGTVGFPMLANTIEAAEGKQTKSLITAFELATKTLGAEARSVPADAQKYKLENSIGESSFHYDKDVCTGLDAGQTFDLGGKSSLGMGWGWLKGDLSVIGSDSSAKESAQSSISSGQKNFDQAQAVIASNVKNSNRIAQFQALKKARDKAKEENASLDEILGGPLLVSDKYTTIQSGTVEDDNLDLMAQLFVSDNPSTADQLDRIATNTASIKKVVDDKLNRMEATIPMAIQDRYVRLRRAHSASLGAEQYMLKALGENDESGPLSDEGFMKLMATKRVKDPRWLSLASADDRFAVQELSEMEAEHLYIKYQRFLAKRDLNVALSQVVANVLERERP